MKQSLIVMCGRLDELTPPGTRVQIDLTITDEYPLAEAFVVISALPEMPDGDVPAVPGYRVC